MDDGVVSYGDVVSEGGGEFLVGAVDDGVVLDVDAVSDAGWVDVASDDGVEPYGSFLAKDDVAHDGGRGEEFAGCGDGGGDSVDGKYEGHGQCANSRVTTSPKNCWAIRSKVGV